MKLRIRHSTQPFAAYYAGLSGAVHNAPTDRIVVHMSPVTRAHPVFPRDPLRIYDSPTFALFIAYNLAKKNAVDRCISNIFQHTSSMWKQDGGGVRRGDFRNFRSCRADATRAVDYGTQNICTALIDYRNFQNHL